VGVLKTHSLLSDGREIIYFDENEDAARAARRTLDQRRLPPRSGAPTMRYDALADEWVAVAVDRQDRTHLPPTGDCPLCPSTGGHLTEIPSSAYDVVVFENRFPSFAGPAAEPFGPEGAFPARPAAGRCEVVCFTSDHDSSFSTLSPARVRTVVEAWIDRSRALAALPDVEQVFCFENRGREIGVTLSHPHGQIYGYPFVTPRTRRMLDAAGRYRTRTGRDLFDDVLQAEVAAGPRIVARSAHWTAFVPFAARWPVQLHLYPNERAASLPDLSEDQRADFCEIYLDLLRRLESAYGGDLPYLSGWHQAPVRTDRELASLHLELISPRRAPGKLKYLAGSESIMGAYVNDLAPEAVAATLRDVAPLL